MAIFPPSGRHRDTCDVHCHHPTQDGVPCFSRLHNRNGVSPLTQIVLEFTYRTSVLCRLPLDVGVGSQHDSTSQSRAAHSNNTGRSRNNECPSRCMKAFMDHVGEITLKLKASTRKARTNSLALPGQGSSRLSGGMPIRMCWLA